MDFLQASTFTHTNGERTHYYHGGDPSGIPLIFIHGWPDIAEVWKHQLQHFSKDSRYRVIAPDMRGYGNSSAPGSRSSYSLEVLTAELVELCAHLHISTAVWVAHDWGCGVINALAAHHPHLFRGMVLLAVPYRTIELGLPHLVSLINRDIYPEADFPFGQWDYMHYYETHTDASIAAFTGHEEKITKVKYAIDPHRAEKHGQPSPGTAYVSQHGGWFGGHPERLPDIPLQATSLDQSLFENLIQSHKKHGWFPPTAYYLNHAANETFSKTEINEGKLAFPVLFIDAKFDAVCSTSTTPRLAEGMRECVPDLEERRLESAHWVQLERWEEVNGLMGEWLGRKV